MKDSLSIYASKFHDALCRLWIHKVSTKGLKGTHRIGIAVSGGVDSMALAHLCQEFRRRNSEKVLGKICFIPFIVDHRTQKSGSTSIQRTKQRLTQMGLQARVLPLVWPEGASPSSLPNFETRARRLRYEALGRACVEDDVTELLLGHHSDDQAETVLMRLAAGHSGEGLRAMAEYTCLPECWGIHGVDHSGYYEKAAKRLEYSRLTNVQAEHPMGEPDPRSLPARPAVFESGGVNALRPLLHFSKEQLRQICEANAIEWEEDETNHDISLTPRNTIRGLLHSESLPRTLQKDALLHLSRQKRAKHEDALWASRRLVENCRIVSFDIRSGVLVVRLPTDTPSVAHKTTSLDILVRAYCLRAIVEAVSPQQDLSLAKMATAASLVSPSLENSDHTELPSQDKPSSFTLCGVHFKRIPLHENRPGTAWEQNPSEWGDQDPQFLWVLSRQPFDEKPTPLIAPGVSISNAGATNVERPRLPVCAPDSHRHWPPWRLWDGRFWIRIRNKSSRTLVLRTWDSNELAAVRNSISRSHFSRFHKTLKVAAPGRIRWTLPVIAEATPQNIDSDTKKAVVNNGSGDDMDSRKDKTLPELASRNPAPGRGQGKILVFPTLGTVGWLDILDETGNQKVEWEVRYKHVQLRRKDDQNRDLQPYDYSFVNAWDDGGQGRVWALQG